MLTDVPPNPCGDLLGVVPVLLGPLQMLLTLLPAILSALLGAALALFRPRTFKTLAIILWRQKLAVAVVMLVVAGGIYGLSPWLARGAKANATETTSATWALFGGDSRRSGFTGQGADPAAGGTNWAFTQDKTFYASPAVVGNRVFAVSAEPGIFGGRGAIYCLDADTGGVVWTCEPKGYRASFSSPVVAGDRLVVGEGLHDVTDARILCLDAHRGEVLWERRTASHVESTPCISDGRVYVGAGDDGYYCLDLADGRVIWRTEPRKFPDAETSPVVLGGRVYVGLGEGGQAVCCLDAADGRELWRTPTPCPVFTAPTVAEGRVYVGIGFANFVLNDQQAYERYRRDHPASDGAAAAPGGAVWCLDAATGNVLWRFATPSTVLASIAAAQGDQVAFATRQGEVICVSKDGQERARWNAHAPILASPAVTADHVYVMAATGRLYGLRRTDLRPIWETAVGAKDQCLSSPAVSRGHVYVGTNGQGLLCLGTPAAADAPQVWAGFLAGPGRSGSLAPESLPGSGERLWSFPAPGATSQPQDAPVSITAPTACVEGRLYVPIAKSSRAGLACLAQDAASEPKELWHFPAAGGAHGSPAADASRVWFVEGAVGQAGRKLWCLAGDSGAPQWQRPIQPAASGQLLLTADSVLIQDEPYMLTCLDPSGRVRWRYATGALVGSPATADLIVLASAEGSLVALDLPTGRRLWQATVKAVAGGPVPIDDHVLLAEGDGLSALRLLDGGRSWHAPMGRAASAIVTDGRLVAYANDRGQAVVLDRASGRLERSFDRALASPPLLCGQTLVFASSDGILCGELTGSASPQRWLRTARWGSLTSPLIVVGGRAYFATDQAGLICAGPRGE